MSDRSRLRIIVLRVVIVSILLTLLGRLGYLQLAQGAIYRKDADLNRVRNIVTGAARGQILDDKGRPLVTNRTALVVSVTRSSVEHQTKAKAAAELAALSRIVGISVPDITAQITPCSYPKVNGHTVVTPEGCWNGSPYQPVPLQSFDDSKPAQVRKVLQIAEHQEDFPGVVAQYQAVRVYPGTSTAAQLLGYIGPLNADDLKAHPAYKNLAQGSEIGRTGVEQVYDNQLRGTDGVEALQVDKDGTVVGTESSTPPVAGQNLVLSIDEGVQKAVEKALAEGIADARKAPDTTRGGTFKAPVGAALVINDTNGQIVAMASNPSYDPTQFVGGISAKHYDALLKAPGDPLLNETVQGSYAPGSTFKIASTAGAVAAGYPLTKRIYPCPGEYPIGQRVFHNFEGEDPGTLDFHDALVRSCDTVYYALAYHQWQKDGGTKNLPTRHEYFAKEDLAFGFAKKTGVDLPDERLGYIPTRASTVQFWQDHKADYCAGAKRRPKGTTLQEDDAAFCATGYVFNGGDAANDVIGQGGVLVTPLQLAMAYAALANGGTLYKPELAKGFVSADGRTSSTIKAVVNGHLPVSQETLTYIRNALGGVTRPPGTAETAFAGWDFNKLYVAGKTGTADVGNNKAPTGWFASFAPLDHPKYVVLVMIPQSGTGGTFAAQTARKIWAAMYGLDGQKAQLPNGNAPGTLPVVRNDGSIAPPGTKVIRPPLPTVTSTPSSNALGPEDGLAYAEPPRRTRWSSQLGKGT